MSIGGASSADRDAGDDSGSVEGTFRPEQPKISKTEATKQKVARTLWFMSFCMGVG